MHYPSLKVAFHTLGCRLNTAETESVMQGVVERGHKIVSFGNAADIVLVNTCTVTKAADSSCRNIIRKAVASSPCAKVVVMGCYAQMAKKTISQMKGVSLVLGTKEKGRFFDYLMGESKDLKKGQSFFPAATSPFGEHTRAFLKIQDGCNYVCSFCIIPFARGRSRTLCTSEIVKQAKGLVKSGFKEIVLTGVNIGEYKKTSGEALEDLLVKILRIKGLFRLRLSSLEANTVTEKFLKVLASSEKSMDYFHIPLQSGDNQILAKMKRKYDSDHYWKVIEKIMKYFPRASIGADIMAGFPGETERQFENTCRLLRELPITHFHVFPYSQRPGTLAAKMPAQIPAQIKKQRVLELIKLGKTKKNQFVKQMQGKVNDILFFEKRNKQGVFEGYTTNFLKVTVDSSHNLQNQIIPVRLKKGGDLF